MRVNKACFDLGGKNRTSVYEGQPGIKIKKVFISDYKLPLAPKREFLAIPNGWRHNCKVVTQCHYFGSDASYNDG